MPHVYVGRRLRFGTRWSKAEPSISRPYLSSLNKSLGPSPHRKTREQNPLQRVCRGDSIRLKNTSHGPELPPHPQDR